MPKPIKAIQTIVTVSLVTLSLAACATNDSSQANPAPPSATEEARADESAPSSTAEGTIVDIAVDNGSFSTLVAALQAADMVDALQGGGPLTVFAPTDEAFAKLPEGALDSLLADKEKLAAVLGYHVVSGSVTAEQVSTMSEASTLAGQSIKIDTSNGVKINDATVIQADIMASNGVIHVIDTVLLPK